MKKDLFSVILRRMINIRSTQPSYVIPQMGVCPFFFFWILLLICPLGSKSIMATAPSFKDVAELMNHVSLGVFPQKDKPGKFTVTFVNKDGKRQFLDRKLYLLEDGSELWKWTVGKELQPKTAEVSLDAGLTLA
jgi:hypothetical protein